LENDYYICVFSDTIHVREDGAIFNILKFARSKKTLRMLILPDQVITIHDEGFASETPWYMFVGVMEVA